MRVVIESVDVFIHVVEKKTCELSEVLEADKHVQYSNVLFAA